VERGGGPPVPRIWVGSWVGVGSAMDSIGEVVEIVIDEAAAEDGEVFATP